MYIYIYQLKTYNMKNIITTIKTNILKNYNDFIVTLITNEIYAHCESEEQVKEIMLGFVLETEDEDEDVFVLEIPGENINNELIEYKEYFVGNIENTYLVKNILEKIEKENNAIFKLNSYSIGNITELEKDYLNGNVDKLMNDIQFKKYVIDNLDKDIVLDKINISNSISELDKQILAR